MEPDGRKRKGKRIREVVLLPLIGINKLLAAFLKKTLGDSYGDITEDDILSMVDAGNESGLFEEASVEMINNVFEFDDLRAEDVMTHRVNLTAIDVKTNLDDIIYLTLEKGFSRIPVYEDNIDHIVGLIIVKDLLCLIGNESNKDFNLKDFLREVIYIPESCSCADVFKFLNNKKSGLAVVVDEYGGTAGILTFEDLIEAIVGNIEDEYDEENTEIRVIGTGKYEIDGETDPEEVLELFGYELPEGHDYDTIAGFVTDLLGYIPEDIGVSKSQSPHVDYKDIRFIVREAQNNRISKIIAVNRNNKNVNSKTAGNYNKT